MATPSNHAIDLRDRRVRIALWSAAAALLAVPWVAMRFTDEVDWTGSDFAVFGGMLLVAGGLYEVAARVARNNAYMLATGIAVAAGFFLVWSNLAVGIIGGERNPANLMFGGVLLVAILGALLANLQPRPMAVAMLATAVAQAIVCAVALLAFDAEPRVMLVLTGFFVACWLASAALFRSAGRQWGPQRAAS